MEHFLGNTTGLEYLAFIFFTAIGMFWIKTAMYNKKKKAGLRANPVKILKFNLIVWLDDNLLDFILAFIAAFVIYRFFPDAFSFISKFQELPEYSDRMFYGLVLGLSFQYLFHKWMGGVTIEKTFDK